MKDPRHLRISDYSYDLPDEKIARYPLGERDASKLLVYKEGLLTDTGFRQLADHLPCKSLLVFNESRVIPARLIFVNDKGQKIELFCLAPDGTSQGTGLQLRHKARWSCLTGGLKKWKPGVVLEKFAFGIGLRASLIENKVHHQIVAFEWEPPELSFYEVVEKMGELPIPPYLGRKTEEIDLTRYQTVYSRSAGSVAAPTAGLHFTAGMLSDLKKREIDSSTLVLHVSAGTFKPVKSAFMAGHDMHEEWMEISLPLLDQLLRHSGDPIIAVGTTSLRALESLYWLGLRVTLDPSVGPDLLSVGQWEPYEVKAFMNFKESLHNLREYLIKHDLNALAVKTAIMIAPPYELRICSGLITNFHQPESTLLLLVSAVVGEKWRAIYQYALENNYRFLSYGDSSLLLK